MCLSEQLDGSLSEAGDLLLDGLELCGTVLERLHVDRALVSDVVEHVHGPDSLRPSLLVAEDEIDPLVQLAADKVALQCLSMQNHKVLGRFGPFRQNHIAHLQILISFVSFGVIYKRSKVSCFEVK